MLGLRSRNVRPLYQSITQIYTIPLSLDRINTNLIWREPAEANSEEGHEAEVECVEERPGLDTRHKHSAAGDIAGEKVRLKERKK